MGKSETIGERIRQRRLALGISVDELARVLKKNRTTIYRYENSYIENLPSSVLIPLAQALQTTPEELVGRDGKAFRPGNAIPVRHLCPIPVIGNVRAGWNGLAFEERLGADYADVGSPAEYFFLRVSGDSMSPQINDGDLALVHQQSAADSGDVVVAVVNGDMGTIKKYIRRGGAVILQPFNPAYEAMVFSGEELNDLVIAGKVVETKRKW